MTWMPSIPGPWGCSAPARPPRPPAASSRAAQSDWDKGTGLVGRVVAFSKVEGVSPFFLRSSTFLPALGPLPVSHPGPGALPADKTSPWFHPSSWGWPRLRPPSPCQGLRGARQQEAAGDIRLGPPTPRQRLRRAKQLFLVP